MSRGRGRPVAPSRAPAPRRRRAAAVRRALGRRCRPSAPARAARDAPVGRGAIYGVAASSAFELRASSSRGRPSTPTPRPSQAPRGRPAARTCSACRPTARGARSASCRPSARRVGVGLPDTLAVRARASASRSSIWKVGARRYLVDRDGRLFAPAAGRAAGGDAALPVVDDRRAASAGLSRRAARSTRSTSTRRRGWRRSSPADIGSAAPRAASASPTRTASCVRHRPARLDRGLRLLHAESPHARTSSRARSACCAACSPVARHSVERRHRSPTSTTGRTSAKPSPSPDGEARMP